MEISRLEINGQSFAECCTLYQDFRISNEMKNDACLSYIEMGRQEVYAPTQKIILQSRESILMKCGNYVANIIEVSPLTPFRSIVFHFHPQSIKQAFGEKELRFLRVDKSKIEKSCALKIDRSVLMDNFVSSLIPYFDHPEWASEDLLLVKLKELIYILSDSGKNEMVSQIIGSLFTPREIAFDQIIQANIYNNLSIAELAFLTARSESTFKRDFKQLYQESPAKYIKKKKLERASELLMKTEMPVSDIAWETGFENLAHFSTSFLNQFGVSPKSYRLI